MKRRSLLAGGAAMFGGMMTEVGGAAGGPADAPPEPGSVRLEPRLVPVLHDADAVVAGGSLAGVAAALSLARSGRTVVLVESRTYLGGEIAASLRPWVEAGAVLPRELRAFFQQQRGNSAGEQPLRLDALKIGLEDLLLGAGVTLIYASTAVGVISGSGEVQALIVGNKSGRQAIGCRILIDASETAAAIRAAGARFDSPGASAGTWTRSIEFTGAAADSDSIAVPARMGVAGNRLRVHRGCRGSGHILLEFDLAVTASASGPFEAARREIEARKRTAALVTYLKAGVPEFRDAFFAASSFELKGRSTPRMAGPDPAWTSGLAGLAVQVNGVALPLPCLAGPLKGIWCLNPAARVPPSAASVFDSPWPAGAAGEEFAVVAARNWERVARSGSDAVPAEDDAGVVAARGLVVREPASPQPGRAYRMLRAPEWDIPVISDVDVLVAGGGTSGATAAAVAAREGLKVLLLEMNPALGGTGTLGGVNSYWFGRRTAFNLRVNNAVQRFHSAFGYKPRSPGRHNQDWSVEAKMQALLEQVSDSGAQVLFNVTATGAIVDGNRIRGVVFATRHGLRAALAKVVIDTTGDGDIAAFAGAEFTYGSALDHFDMWYNLAAMKEPGRPSNSFTTSVEISNVEDYTRAILAARRRVPDCHDHGIYVAPRESRHIRGDETITLTDQLRQRAWPDVVNIHYSNHDIKGKSCSQWLNAGLIPPELEVEIPYGALLPRGLEGLLVAAKALSTTHDGIAAIRMQPDMENLGGVAGLAGAQAVKEGRTPRRIDRAALQRRLVSEGVLPARVLERKLISDGPRRASRRDLEAVASDRPLLAYQDMDFPEVFRGRIPLVDLCVRGAAAVPQVEEFFEQTPAQAKTALAKALCLIGSRAAVPFLLAEIENALVPPKVPHRTNQIRHVGIAPNQAGMPDVAFLIYCLGMSRDRRSIGAWQRVVDLLDPKEEDFRSLTQGTYYYADSVCFGAQRLGDPAAVPVLERLHDYPTLHGLVSRKGAQEDMMLERRAWLELAIGAALARCGSPRGFDILISYLDDCRRLLARQAHSQLVSMTGRDCGIDSRAWLSWLKSGAAPGPSPLLADPDAVFEPWILLEA